jgi:hypothetical protein
MYVECREQLYPTPDHSADSDRVLGRANRPVAVTALAGTEVGIRRDLSWDSTN